MLRRTRPSLTHERRLTLRRHYSDQQTVVVVAGRDDVDVISIVRAVVWWDALVAGSKADLRHRAGPLPRCRVRPRRRRPHSVPRRAHCARTRHCTRHERRSLAGGRDTTLPLTGLRGNPAAMQLLRAQSGAQDRRGRVTPLVRPCDAIGATIPVARRAGRRPTSKHLGCRSPGAGVDAEADLAVAFEESCNGALDAPLPLSRPDAHFAATAQPATQGVGKSRDQPFGRIP